MHGYLKHFGATAIILLLITISVTTLVCVCAGHTSSNVAEAVRYSEESRTKCIGLTIETRPDYCLGPHLSDMLSYGCTRLEIGLQVETGLRWSACSCIAADPVCALIYSAYGTLIKQ